MNYISHIQLADHTRTSLVGAFLGDFVKGSDLSGFSFDKRLAIQLHRKIDSFTDTHESLNQVKALFPKRIKRYSGIALDIYFDHLLMSNWPRQSISNVEDMFVRFYDELEQTFYGKNSRYTRVKEALLQERWLSHYQDEQTSLRAMKSIEGRFRHTAVFADEAFEVLVNNRMLLEECFDAFYPELMEAAEGFSRQLKARLLSE